MKKRILTKVTDRLSSWSFKALTMGAIACVALCFPQKGVSQSTTLTSPWPATTHLTSGGADAGVPFAIENTNGFPIKVTSLDCAGDYEPQTGAVFQLWYSATSTGAMGTVSNGAGWVDLPAGSPVNTTQFTVINVLSNMNFIIPANTTYRCFIRSSLDLGCKSSPGNGQVSGGGVNLIYNSPTYPCYIGFFPSGTWYSPYAFVGAITFEPAINAMNNAGVEAIVNPIEGFCGGNSDVEVTIANQGENQITAVDVAWSVNGVAQTTYSFTGLLDTLNGNGSTSATVNLGSYNFEGPIDLRVWTTMPNGVNDTVNGNDTATMEWFAPNPEVDIPDAVICSGGFKILNAGTYESYIWSTGYTGDAIVVSEAGVYGVTVTDEYGCEAEDQVQVTVEETPVPDFSTEVEGCGEALLNAGNAGATFAWSTGESGQIISVMEDGGYVVTITSPEGCVGVGQTYVDIHPLPFSYLGEDFSLCMDYPSVRILNVEGAGNVGYQWSTNDSTSSIVLSGEGKTKGKKETYSVTVTDENNCTSTDTVEVTYKECIPAGVSNVSSEEGFKVYPNPASGMATLVIHSDLSATYYLHDVTGRVLMSGNSNGKSQLDLNLTGIAPGQHFLKLETEDNTYVKPIIIK